MSSNRNQREVENRMRDALEPDRARVQVGRISRFGLLEMSRQRLRPSLGETSAIVCPRCSGQGTIRDVESLSLSILRILQEEANKQKCQEVRATVPLIVSSYLLNEKRLAVTAIEQQSNTRLVIVSNPEMETPHYEITALNQDAESYDVESTSVPVPAANVKPEEQTTTVQKPSVSNVPTARTPPPSKGLLASLSGAITSLFSTSPKQSAKPQQRRQQANRNRNRQQSSSQRNQQARDSTSGRSDRAKQGKQQRRKQAPAKPAGEHAARGVSDEERKQSRSGQSQAKTQGQSRGQGQAQEKSEQKSQRRPAGKRPKNTSQRRRGPRPERSAGGSEQSPAASTAATEARTVDSGQEVVTTQADASTQAVAKAPVVKETTQTTEPKAQSAAAPTPVSANALVTEPSSTPRDSEPATSAPAATPTTPADVATAPESRSEKGSVAAKTVNEPVAKTRIGGEPAATQQREPAVSTDQSTPHSSSTDPTRVEKHSPPATVKSPVAAPASNEQDKSTAVTDSAPAAAAVTPEVGKPSAFKAEVEKVSTEKTSMEEVSAKNTNIEEVSTEKAIIEEPATAAPVGRASNDPREVKRRQLAEQSHSE